jgi:ketosteroid isomerase-like protein
LVELLAKKDSVGFGNSYTEDAKFMGYNQPSTEGRKAIQTIWAQNMNADATNITLTTVEVWGNKTTLTEEGMFDFKSKEGVTLDKGKYIVVWVNDNGTWKIHRDIFNSDLPATK